MRNRGLGAVLMGACMFAGSGVAIAGAKRVYNNNVKAQCIAKADAENLTGHARHIAVKQCKEEGLSFSLPRFLNSRQ